ncbi:hypothetical protein DCAR_0310161 [Daucus carota subsp. sativus]|uniref:HAT C-terminal dimerisation domain-containing protein n=1 Tax=Daucus carota subsp. sativus TaxID=79200 RepID=A0AAF1APP5_DAUCS|nr:hypothetical protein DCAR_0310161 [Daucus carota subsp. sativus]
MLEAAVKYEKAFKRLEEDDLSYFNYFLIGDEEDVTTNTRTKAKKKKKRKEVVGGPPSENDFEIARNFLKFLKLFYRVTEKISGSKYVTSNLFFDELVKMHVKIGNMCFSEHARYLEMAKRMKAKYDKYWDNIDNINFLFYVAVLLDPRRKMQYIDYCFSQIYPDEKEKQILMKEKVKSTLDAFYKDYARLQEGQTSGNTSKKYSVINSNIAPMSIDDEEDEEDDVDLIANFQKHLESEDSMTNKSEVDIYMSDAIERNLGDDFNILQWWKMSSVKFPILSQVAKNVLGMPISTVASESAFSTGGRVIDPFRSSLTPKTAEALICTQDWIRSKNSKQIDLETSQPFALDGIRKQLEEIEKGILNF